MNRPSLKKIFVIFLASSVALSALLIVSYGRAKQAADRLIKPIQDKDHYVLVHARLSPILSITGKWGPSWEFFYDPNDLGVGDWALQISLFGNFIGSNPGNAIAIIKEMQNTAEQDAAANP
jgi:hypothetical protein